MVVGFHGRTHVLTLDRRRTLRGVGKSWPQSGASRGGQAELSKKDPVLMGRPLLLQERFRHGEALKPPGLIPLGRSQIPTNQQRLTLGNFLPLKNQLPDPVRHST